MPHGWMAKGTIGRPKTRFYSFLAVLWATVGGIGALLVWQGQDMALEPGIRNLAWLVLLPEPVFIGLAVFFRFTEVPQKLPTPPDWHGPILH